MKIALLLTTTLILSSCMIYGQETTSPPPVPTQETPNDVEVLTSGPVHEAFAEPVDLKPESGIVVTSPPPNDIDENTPAERPAGQYVWVPGYWAWDSQRGGYIWVSGCWRLTPPTRYWVPGYWAKIPQGWQWVPGFWASSASIGQIEYLPAPPELIDVEPPVIVSTTDVIWVPPCWYWSRGHYVLRSGYWLNAQPDWIWAPSHYVWTPRGYVFVEGHWDYLLSRRGVLFAPVYFPRRLYEGPRFSYSLSIIIDTGSLQFGLFTYPRYCHYYFGDYYDDVYLSIGIFPCFQSRIRYTWYDPLYEHNRWHYTRNQPLWDSLQRKEYELRRSDRDMRPPKTYNEMVSRMDKMPPAQRRDIKIAQPIKAVVTEKQSLVKFESANDTDRQRTSRKASEVRQFSQERSQWESQPSVVKSVSPTSPTRGSAEPSTGQPQQPGTRRGSPEPSTGQPQQPSVGSRGPSEPSTGPRGNTTAPVAVPQQPASTASERGRTTRQTAPSGLTSGTSERIKTTSPPISNRSDPIGNLIGGLLGRKGPPSQPSSERKTESSSSKSSSSSSSSQGSSSSDSGSRRSERRKD
jgi:hypothetical protein